jgi:molybdopterin molybdotransferase
MTAPIPLEEAWERLFALARPLGSETVPVDEGEGRWLAKDLVARRTQPDADFSAMDGFAVAGSGPWRIVGEARAGFPFGGVIGPGEATRISTGAACPPGTQAIVLIEDAELAGDRLAAEAPEPGLHIRRRGFDFASGETLLESGRHVGPVEIALARAAGHGSLQVACKPAVAVIECGDELVADPAECPPGRLPASNGAMVAAMVAGLANVQRMGPLPDDRALLTQAFAEASGADVIVTTAGASVGAHDHVRGALEDCGAELDFWRVAIRPGKPLLVARLGRRIVLGLPGNPASSFVTAFLFLLPLVRALQGAGNPRPAAMPLTLAGNLPRGGDRREFRRAVLSDNAAHPIEERDSSALRALAAADLLIDRPIGAVAASSGDIVPAYWLGNGGMA